MNALRNAVLAWLLACCSVNASAEIIYREVSATGFGVNVAEAVIDALETALSQVNGQRLSTFTALRISAGQQDGIDKLDESFQRNIEKSTRGVVKAYTLHETGLDPEGRTFAKLDAVIPIYRASEQMERLRLAVEPLMLSTNLRENPRAREFADSVSSALEACLTQTRKFAVLDRRYGAATARELQATSDLSSPIEESVRVGLRAVADYLVIASLRDFAYESAPQRRLSGRVVERTRAPLSIAVRVIDISSGQVKFAQSYRHSGVIPAGDGLPRLALDVAADIAEEINFAIYPVAVLGTLGEGEFTLNQGGQTVQLGRIYRLVQLGANLIDPYTRESLGPQEREIGRVEITSVTDRTATARMVAGVPPEMVQPGTLIIRLLPEEFQNTGAIGLSAPLSLGNSTSPSPKDTRSTSADRKTSDDW